MSNPFGLTNVKQAADYRSATQHLADTADGGIADVWAYKSAEALKRVAEQTSFFGQGSAVAHRSDVKVADGKVYVKYVASDADGDGEIGVDESLGARTNGKIVTEMYLTADVESEDATAFLTSLGLSPEEIAAALPAGDGSEVVEGVGSEEAVTPSEPAVVEGGDTKGSDVKSAGSSDGSSVPSVPVQPATSSDGDEGDVLPAPVTPGGGTPVSVLNPQAKLEIESRLERNRQELAIAWDRLDVLTRLARTAGTSGDYSLQLQALHVAQANYLRLEEEILADELALRGGKTDVDGGVVEVKNTSDYFSAPSDAGEGVKNTSDYFSAPSDASGSVKNTSDYFSAPSDGSAAIIEDGLDFDAYFHNEPNIEYTEDFFNGKIKIK